MKRQTTERARAGTMSTTTDRHVAGHARGGVCPRVRHAHTGASPGSLSSGHVSSYRSSECHDVQVVRVSRDTTYS